MENPNNPTFTSPDSGSGAISHDSNQPSISDAKPVDKVKVCSNNDCQYPFFSTMPGYHEATHCLVPICGMPLREPVPAETGTESSNIQEIDLSDEAFAKMMHSVDNPLPRAVELETDIDQPNFVAKLAMKTSKAEAVFIEKAEQYWAKKSEYLPMEILETCPRFVDGEFGRRQGSAWITVMPNLIDCDVAKSHKLDELITRLLCATRSRPIQPVRQIILSVLRTYSTKEGLLVFHVAERRVVWQKLKAEYQTFLVLMNGE